LKRLTVITLQYYRSLLLYNIAFTLLICLLFGFNAVVTYPAIFLFAKITGVLCAGSLHYYSANETYFYYRNAGFSMRRICLITFAFDLLICLALISLSTLIARLCLH